MRFALNPFTGRASEAHFGSPDEGENAECQEPNCKGVMVPQIERWLVSNTNPQWYWCDGCGTRVRKE